MKAKSVMMGEKFLVPNSVIGNFVTDKRSNDEEWRFLTLFLFGKMEGNEVKKRKGNKEIKLFHWGCVNML